MLNNEKTNFTYNINEINNFLYVLIQKTATCFKPGPVKIDLSTQQNSIKQISFAYKTEDLNSTLLLYQVPF